MVHAPAVRVTIREVNRWAFVASLLCGAAGLAEEPKAVVRGKLTKSSGGRPALETKEGKLVFLEGDDPTIGVVKDKRLLGSDFEAIGKFTSPDVLTIDPIHTKAMFVHRDGRRLAITYWCEVCSIRTYTPGVCWCCQEETDLDLRDPSEQ
jgi:hypothetical protein